MSKSIDKLTKYPKILSLILMLSVAGCFLFVSCTAPPATPVVTNAIVITPTIADKTPTPALGVIFYSGTVMPTSSLAPTAYYVASFLQSRWLKGIPCRLPCWEGITPGKTSATEALELLQKNPLVDNIQKEKIRENLDEISWRWKTDDKSGGVLFLRSLDPKQPVYAILPGIKSHTTLGDVIRAYGEPSHVWVKERIYSKFETLGTPVPSSYEANIIWIPQGFALALTLNNKTDRFDSRLLVGSPAIFEPTREGYLAYQGNSGSYMLNWHGYDEIANYLVP